MKAVTIPGFDLVKIGNLLDSVSRRTPPNDGETHQLLAEVNKLMTVALKLEEDRQKAWGDADHAAWRTAASSAYQSLLMMNGVTALDGNQRVYATDAGGSSTGMVSAMSGEECAARSMKRLDALAKLAEEAGVAMLRRDRARREASR